MSERREKVIQEIKEVAERIELKLFDYRIMYYKEMPVTSKKKIYNSLEKAFCETDKLCFVNEMTECVFLYEIAKLKCKCTSKTVYSHLEIVVNETLKYFNDVFANKIYGFINTLQEKLKYSDCCSDVDFDFLKENLITDKAFKVLCEKYPDLIELRDCILTITKIEFLTRSILKPEIYELYGLKSLLEEFEDKILNIDINSFDGTDSFNIILEYINCRINFNWFKEIK